MPRNILYAKEARNFSFSDSAISTQQMEEILLIKSISKVIFRQRYYYYYKSWVRKLSETSIIFNYLRKKRKRGKALTLIRSA